MAHKTFTVSNGSDVTFAIRATRCNRPRRGLSGSPDEG
jgi:hypothetical protein